MKARLMEQAQGVETLCGFVRMKATRLTRERDEPERCCGTGDAGDGGGSPQTRGRGTDAARCWPLDTAEIAGRGDIAGLVCTDAARRSLDDVHAEDYCLTEPWPPARSPGTR